MIETLQPFAIAFVIGLIIGIERERSHPNSLQAIGVRTFSLLALLGSLAATLDSVVLTTGLFIFALATILVSYIRSTDQRHPREAIGLTTEFAAAIVFCLGYLAKEKPLVAGILGVAVLLTLLGKQKLHTFSREKLTPKEIQAATIMIIVAVVILPFLPNKTIDIWGLFNPRRFGLLVMIIAIVQFGGYVAVRILGNQIGIILTGFFGGLVSSTTVFLNLPRIVSESPQIIFSAVAAGLLATVGMLVESLFILSIISLPLMSSLFIPILAMILTGAFLAFILQRGHIHNHIITGSINPLDFKAVLRLAIFISIMLILVATAKNYLGSAAVHTLAFLAGLFEVHSTTMATATLHAHQLLILNEARSIIAIAIGSSYVTKFIILFISARNRFGFITATSLLAMLSIGTITFLITN